MKRPINGKKALSRKQKIKRQYERKGSFSKEEFKEVYLRQKEMIDQEKELRDMNKYLRNRSEKRKRSRSSSRNRSSYRRSSSSKKKNLFSNKSLFGLSIITLSLLGYYLYKFKNDITQLEKDKMTPETLKKLNANLKEITTLTENIDKDGSLFFENLEATFKDFKDFKDFKSSGGLGNKVKTYEQQKKLITTDITKRLKVITDLIKNKNNKTDSGK